MRSEYKGENSDLLTASLAGGSTRVLTDTPDADETDPSYSPDGRLIVFQSHGTHSRESHIFTIHPDGGHLRELTSGSQPSISPSGRSIAFDRSGSIWQMGIGGRDPRLIMAADVPGGAREPDPNSRSFRNSDPVYSPDGSRILFVRHRMLPEFGTIPRNFTLWTMRPDGTEMKNIPVERGATVIERGADWQAVGR